MEGLEKFGVGYEKDGKKYFCFHPWVKEVVREQLFCRRMRRMDKKYLN